ncbi:endonuclease III [Clostridium sp. JS66]|uniref:endonuclease III n=1 Tax=Clostridium sp. JS66 TaxID=3064705 RepID=UPI00298DA19E|nr:endonuclease III [Clostridium sp. JS66]WPC40890.1 endonuclease III [Clostridium sp. JS66]
MNIDEKMYDFTITVLKCFFILIVLGLFLPKLLDYVFYNFINKPNIYDNSILVNNLVHRNIDILNNYIIVFNKFLGLW